MDRAVFFQELGRVLQREGFTTQAEQDSLLPVEWDGHPLCRITEGGGVRYRQEDVATLEREQACEQATHLAGIAREYTTPRDLPLSNEQCSVPISSTTLTVPLV